MKLRIERMGTMTFVLATVLAVTRGGSADATDDGEIPLASPHAAAVETPSSPSAWGGPRTGSETTLSDRVVRYEIDAKLEPISHTIEGKERLTWRNRSDRAVKSVFLHLYLNAFEGPGSTFFTESRRNGMVFRSNVGLQGGEWGHIELTGVTQHGAAASWHFVHPDGGPETDHTVVRLDLPEAVPAGASTTLDIDFRDQLPRVVARTGYFGTFHLVGQWFPKIGVLELPGERGATEPRWNAHEFHMHSEFYADFGEYDVRITVPKTYQVASAGAEEGAPIAAGDLVTHRFVQNDIHDFAWMAVDNFEPPIAGSYDGPGSPHVDVKVFYPAEYVASAKSALKATIDSIKWFSDTLGPYPYRTSTCIVPPYNAREAGGMEYQTFFTASGFPATDEGTFSAAAIDFVTIHEFGHGYFYGLLASNEFEEPFLDEGMNDYWDMRMLRARKQLISPTTSFLKAIGIAPALDAFVLERLGGVLKQQPADPVAQNAWDRVSTDSYRQVYSRTATVMHDLEERLGHDVTERAFRAYYAKWHFRHPSTADLREALAEASGDRATVEQVFRQYIYGREIVDDRVDSLISEEVLPEAGSAIEDGKRVEKTKETIDREIDSARAAWKSAHGEANGTAGPFPFRTTVTLRRDGVRVPQRLVVKFEDGTTEQARWDDDTRWRRFSFVKPARAKSAELDEDRQYYLDYNKANDGRTLDPERAAGARWTGDFAAIVEVLYGFLGAL